MSNTQRVKTFKESQEEDFEIPARTLQASTGLDGISELAESSAPSSASRQKEDDCEEVQICPNCSYINSPVEKDCLKCSQSLIGSSDQTEDLSLKRQATQTICPYCSGCLEKDSECLTCKELMSARQSESECDTDRADHETLPPLNTANKKLNDHDLKKMYLKQRKQILRKKESYLARENIGLQNRQAAANQRGQNEQFLSPKRQRSQSKEGPVERQRQKQFNTSFASSLSHKKKVQEIKVYKKLDIPAQQDENQDDIDQQSKADLIKKKAELEANEKLRLIEIKAQEKLRLIDIEAEKQLKIIQENSFKESIIQAHQETNFTPKRRRNQQEMKQASNQAPYLIAKIQKDGRIGDLNGRVDSTQIKIDKNSLVKFQLDYSNSDICNQPRLILNQQILRSEAGQQNYFIVPPIDADQQFDESLVNPQYYIILEPRIDSSKSFMEFEMTFKEAGLFFFQIEYKNRETGKFQYSHHQAISVQPHLNGKTLSELKMLSVVTRRMGKLNRWPLILDEAISDGFNAINFSPFQELNAESSMRSTFSISNFNQVSDYFFDNPKSFSKQHKTSKVKDTFKELQDQGITVINDIVLDQASFDAKWLSKIPNATYNIENCPNLFAAWVLDQALHEFSLNFANDQIPDLDFAPNIITHVNITKLMLYLKEQVIEPLQISEFFQINITQIIFEVSKLFHTFAFNDGLHDTLQHEKRNFELLGWIDSDPFEILLNKLAKGFGAGPNRFGVTIDVNQAIALYIIKNDNDKERGKQQLGDDLIKFNQHWREKCGELLDVAIQSIESYIKQVRIIQNQPTVSEKSPLFERYFSQLYDGTIVALGGQMTGQQVDIGNEDTVINGWNYLLRTIKIETGNVILRYGNGPSDCPLLWDHMLSYVQEIASISDGIRIHNAKSVPQHVLHFMLSAARSKNPNLIVMAEVQASNEHNYQSSASALGLTYVIKNLQEFNSCSDIAKSINDSSSQEPNLKDIHGNPFKNLCSSRPNEIWFDSSHDNASLIDTFGSLKIALPLMSLNSSSPCATASTWGFDLLLEKPIEKFEQEMLYGVNIPVQFDPSQIFEQEFWIDYETANRVSVAGDFNKWSNDQFYLSRDENGIWCGTKKLKFKSADDAIQYKFVIDGKEWVHNEILPLQTDPNGHQNNIVKAESFLMPPPSGLRSLRKTLSDIHTECNEFNAKTAIEVQNDEIMVTTRQFRVENCFCAYVFIQKLNMGWSSDQQDQQRRKQGSIEITLPGLLDQVVFAGRLIKSAGDPVENDDLFIQRNDTVQVGWQSIEEFCQVTQVVDNWGSEQKSKLAFYTMPEGMTCVLKVRLNDQHLQALQNLNSLLGDAQISELCAEVPAAGLNHLLFRCQSEEMIISQGKRSPYSLGDRGELAYAGLTSILHIIKGKSLRDKEAKLDFEALRRNMEDGDWLMDFTIQRLESYHEANCDLKLEKLISFIKHAFSLLKSVPQGFKSDFEIQLYEALYAATKREIVWQRCQEKFLCQSEDLMSQQLLMATYQFWGRDPSVQFQNHRDTLCHGMSFSPEHFRKRGRDTFIAMRCMLLNGMEAEARDCLIQFAKVTRHGLIPNIHGNGERARFDSRDTTWFFLQAIKDYVNISEEGTSFLNTQVRLYFHDDDRDTHLEMKNSKERERTLSIFELILDILKRHAEGVKFSHWSEICDQQNESQRENFEVSIDCDLEETGFCFGGKKSLCATWMDSIEADSLITPRDGAPIELVALQYSILTWMTELNSKGLLLESGISVSRTVKKVITREDSQNLNSSVSFDYKANEEIFRYVIEESEVSFSKWAAMLKNNFERCFWIPENQAHDHNHDIFQEHVHRRGIYKDVYRSSDGYTDYQLRPNVCIAMSIAPSLFDHSHANTCLKNVGDILMDKESLGIKSLDPNDYNFKGDLYGQNHHQGPEWIWPLGFFFKAKLLFSNYKSREEASKDIFTKLEPIKNHLLSYSNKHEGLPNFTNSQGSLCSDAINSNFTSIATILDALSELNQFGEGK